MAEISTAIYSLNGGEVGRDIIARFDLDRLRFAATTMENFLPFRSGKMQLRPGFEFMTLATDGDVGIWRPFFNTNTQNFLLHFASNNLRIYEVTENGVTAIRNLTNAPWSAAQAKTIKTEQINDVMYIASSLAPMQLEFRGGTNWQLIPYQPEDGPFDIGPEEQTISLNASSSLSTNTTITASQNYFSSTDIGLLLRLRIAGLQNVTEALGNSNPTSNSIRVFGNTENRQRFTAEFSVSSQIVSSGRLVLEQSIGDDQSWRTFRFWQINAREAQFFRDRLNDDIPNIPTFYRFNYLTTNDEEEVVLVRLLYSGGTTETIARVTSYSSPTRVRVSANRNFASTRPTNNWDEGSWSTTKGWPTSVVYHSGRLMWGRRNQIFASESDRFETFTNSTEGDASAFTRSVLSKSTDGLLWLIDNQRLIAGAQNTISFAWSSTFSENLTASDFTSRIAASVGSLNYQGQILDSETLFIDQTRRKLYILKNEGAQADFNLLDTTEINRDILEPGINGFAIQRQPETRIWCVMADGTMRCLTYEPSQNVLAWSRITTEGGQIVGVYTLPGVAEDSVLILFRQDDGEIVIERLRSLNEADGSTQNAMLDHRAELPYRGRWQSTKLAYGATPPNTALGAEKRVHHLGLYMLDTQLSGVRVGPSFDNLHGLARTQLGKPVDFDTVQSEFTAYPQPFGGSWDIDSRICIEVNSPNPCTIAALVIGMDTNDDTRKQNKS